MADKRKNNRGHKGVSGRKSKAEELKVSAYALGAIKRKYGSVEQFWDFIAEQSLESKDHLKHLLEYAYGKPHQSLNADLSIKEVIVDFTE